MEQSTGEIDAGDNSKNTPVTEQEAKRVTCTSREPHSGADITDRVEHYFSCLEEANRKTYWDDELANDSNTRQKITRRIKRAKSLEEFKRDRLEAFRAGLVSDKSTYRKRGVHSDKSTKRDPGDDKIGKELRGDRHENEHDPVAKLQLSLHEWRKKKSSSRRRPFTAPPRTTVKPKPYDPNRHTKVRVVQYQSNRLGGGTTSSGNGAKTEYKLYTIPDDPRAEESPNQWLTVSELLQTSQDGGKPLDPFAGGTLLEPGDRLRWIHFPANNMKVSLLKPKNRMTLPPLNRGVYGANMDNTDHRQTISGLR